MIRRWLVRLKLAVFGPARWEVLNLLATEGETHALKVALALVGDYNAATYRVLDAMEKDGLVTSRLVASESDWVSRGGHPKRLYEITEKGQTALSLYWRMGLVR